MRTPVVTYVVVAALALAVVGCGDSNDTNIVIGEEPTFPTPTSVIRTATRTPTPARTTIVPTPVATVTTGDGATPSATTTAESTPAPTATPGGSIDADVQRIAADILPFLTNTALLTGGSTSALTVANAPIVDAVKTDSCPDGGSRVDDEGFPARTLTFNACDVSDTLGSFEFDGQVIVTLSSFGGGTIVFDFTLTDRATDHAIDFSGTLTLTVASGGFVLDGPLTVSTPEGGFTLNNNHVTVNANRKIVSGSGTVTDDDDNFDLQMVAFVVTNGGAASSLTVTFDDSSVHTYRLDLETGALTQNS
jgi:hypothetical protein